MSLKGVDSMPFKNPFKTQEGKKSKTGAKILFWIIATILAYAIISQVF